MLELHEVDKTFASGQDEICAADGISLTVEAGELVALFGPSGSGKTTLLLLAAGILRPDSGQVRFGGRDLAAMSDREAAAHRLRNIGIVFQGFHLIRGARALDNATVKLLGEGASRRNARRRAHVWLDRVGIGSKEASYPPTMSAGEQQRVAVARALANGPRLLLADEPTGNLDSASSRTVLSLLAEICHSRGLAVLLATHDPTALDFADRALLLRDGKLSEQPAAPERRMSSDAS